ncbi:adenosine deaminase [Pochonia chlamydosporia 170]|uniref:Adenine deaminase n=1 Tax=Pochonia chlamydosporia 170 TaxID=1380566 RepID=A0A179F6J2_METCM|nr:adenosine deaminase [Pochonia chlamydosporia 170]OAQ61076.1 adenosine deaminase [Pochonia chlamydosporia 170]
MCQSKLHNLLTAIPKVEQHLHIEGTLEPALLFSLASKNNIPLPPDPVYTSSETLVARYQRFTSLDDFLHYYYLGMSVLITAQDFETLAWEYFTKAASQKVRHAEVFFDPQAHTCRGVSYDTVMEGLLAAKQRAQKEFNMTVEYIVCILRHLPISDSHALVDTVLSKGHFTDGTLIGFGMVSSEKNFPPHLFRDIYTRVAATGTHLTTHAGEEAGPGFVTEALSQLNVERIDHGLASAQDPDLLNHLATSKTLLTFCPWSNVVLCNLPKLEDAPVKKFLEAGVRFSLNSDDPAYFGAYIQDVYCRVQETFHLTVQDWDWIVRGAVAGSWCSSERKDEITRELDSVLAAFAAET